MLPSKPQQERALAVYVKSSAEQITQCVTLADMADLLKIKIEREEESRHFIRRSPYPHKVIQKKKKKNPYPEWYVTPNFSIQHKL